MSDPAIVVYTYMSLQSHTTQDLISSMTNLISKFNAKVDVENAKREKQNNITYASWREGKISAADARKKHLPMKEKAHGKPSRTWALRQRRRFGWSKRALNTPGNFLAYDHPAMVKIRKNFAEWAKTANMHPRLCLNYDQLYKPNRRQKKEKLFKLRGEAGKRGDPGRSEIDAGRTRTKHARDIAAAGGVPADKKRRKPSMSDPDSRVDTATNGREACTVVTSTYSDGTRGPLCLCFAEGKVSQAMAEDYNTRYEGKVLIISSKTESHFMTAETTLELFERLYTPALRLTLSTRSNPVCIVFVLLLYSRMLSWLV